MPYVALPERVALREGLLQAINVFLEERFGAEGRTLVPQIETLNEIRPLIRVIATATTLDDVRRAIAEEAAPPKKKKGKTKKSGD